MRAIFLCCFLLTQFVFVSSTSCAALLQSRRVQVQPSLDDLKQAVAQNNLELIESIAKANPSLLEAMYGPRKYSVLHFAVESGKLEAVKQLLKSGASQTKKDKQTQTALHMAIQQAKPEIAKVLIESAANQKQRSTLNEVDRNGATALMACVSQRRLPGEVLDLLISKGVEVNVKNRSQQTALHLACYYRRPDLGAKLIKAGAEIGSTDNNQNTPLLAASNSSAPLVKLLLEKGANVKAVNRQGQTALHMACRSRQLETVKLLLDRFDEVDLEDKQKQTPLAMAVMARSPEMAQALIERGADPNQFNEPDGSRFSYPLICRAATNGNKALLEVLLDGGAKLNVKSPEGDGPLHLVCQAGGNIFDGPRGTRNSRSAGKPFLDSIKLLLSRKADPNQKNNAGQTPIQVAAKRDFFDAVEILVEKTDELNFDLGDGSLLHWTAKNGLPKTAKHLLDSKKTKVNSLDANGKTPIQVAAENGHVAMIDLLIQGKAIVDQVSTDGLTPLLIAANAGHSDVVRSLLNAGADLSRLDETGQSCLHLAAWNGGTEVVAELMEKLSAKEVGNAQGFSKVINAKTKSGYTALHAAAWNGHAGVAKLLLKAKADPNATDSDGWTPLHKAAYRGHVEVVKQLLAAGTDRSIKNGVGMTARDMAGGDQKVQVIELLK
ncbi:MAG: ankyrin repeat domain-containing protein [Mariniblastus sp.]